MSTEAEKAKEEAKKAAELKAANEVNASGNSTALVATQPIPTQTTLETKNEDDPSPTPPVKPYSEKGDPDASKGNKDFWERFVAAIFAVMNTKTGKMFAAAGEKLWEKTPQFIKKPIVAAKNSAVGAVNKKVNAAKENVVAVKDAVNRKVVEPINRKVVEPINRKIVSPVKRGAKAVVAKKDKAVKAVVAKKDKVVGAAKESVKTKLNSAGSALKEGATSGLDSTKQGVKAAGSALSHAATAVKEKLSRQKDHTSAKKGDNSFQPAHARQRSMSNSQRTPLLKPEDPNATAKQKVGARTPPPSPPRKNTMSQ
ncbi:MAG TPA: hypothetical protein VNK03_00470 [Gammaproteobacteria bacterium]|nr:hypothetical protein [Gammaproteobacteria bacterium]